MPYRRSSAPQTATEWEYLLDNQPRDYARFLVTDLDLFIQDEKAQQIALRKIDKMSGLTVDTSRELKNRNEEWAENFNPIEACKTAVDVYRFNGERNHEMLERAIEALNYFIRQENDKREELIDYASDEIITRMGSYIDRMTSMQGRVRALLNVMQRQSCRGGLSFH